MTLSTITTVAVVQVVEAVQVVVEVVQVVVGLVVGLAWRWARALLVDPWVDPLVPTRLLS
jgi:hypothetical protein